MAQRQSTEQQRTLIAVRAGRHPDTVRRYANGLPVTETTRRAIEDACVELEADHIVLERRRALAGRGRQP